jgi:glycosyltransferase 2 family protein
VKSWRGTALRAAVSGVLIGVLIYVALRQHVWQNLKTASPKWVAIGAVFLALAWTVNSCRWGLLLRAAGVVETLGGLISLYWIGMFFSQILPTGAGGDAVRMWAISRRHGKPTAAIVATFQERLVGMGMSCLLGLCVGAAYFDHLPAKARWWFVAVQALMMAVAAAGLYPRPLLRLARVIPSKKLAAAIAHVARLEPLTAGCLLPVLAVGLAGILLSIGEWWALGRAVGVYLPYAVYCTIVPLVWIIGMTPSLGGTGVREGGFVMLMKLFDVPTDRSLAVAALYLIVQTALAGVGGLLLLGQVWAGRWKRT